MTFLTLLMGLPGLVVQAQGNEKAPPQLDTEEVILKQVQGATHFAFSNTEYWNDNGYFGVKEGLYFKEKVSQTADGRKRHYEMLHGLAKTQGENRWKSVHLSGGFTTLTQESGLLKPITKKGPEQFWCEVGNSIVRQIGASKRLDSWQGTFDLTKVSPNMFGGHCEVSVSTKKRDQHVVEAQVNVKSRVPHGKSVSDYPVQVNGVGKITYDEQSKKLLNHGWTFEARDKDGQGFRQRVVLYRLKPDRSPLARLTDEDMQYEWQLSEGPKIDKSLSAPPKDELAYFLVLTQLHNGIASTAFERKVNPIFTTACAFFVTAAVITDSVMKWTKGESFLEEGYKNLARDFGVNAKYGEWLGTGIRLVGGVATSVHFISGGVGFLANWPAWAAIPRGMIEFFGIGATVIDVAETGTRVMETEEATSGSILSNPWTYIIGGGVIVGTGAAVAASGGGGGGGDDDAGTDWGGGGGGGDTGGGSSGGLTDVTVSQRNISITVYDHGAIDGDKIDLIVNGTYVLTDHVLDGPPGTTRNVTLNSGNNQIVVHADNTGDVGPNTATLEISHVTSGDASQVWRVGLNEDASLVVEAP
jgi:hypothetical protein